MTAVAQATIAEAGVPLGLSRADCVVCVPVFGVPNLVLRSIGSVLQHTPHDVHVLFADDCSAPEDFELMVTRIAELARGRPGVHVYRQALNRGFTANANAAFACAGEADVLLVNSDCVVSEGFYEGMRAAAYSSSVVATATAMTNNGVYVSVPARNGPGDLPAGWTVDGMARAVREASLRLRPRIPTAAGHCVYFRRSALDLVGPFDECFSPGYGEEVDFSQRCARSGLQHVVADDVFVYHGGGLSFGGDGRVALIEDHERLIRSRYPHYADWVTRVSTDPENSLARSVRAVTQAVEGISVTVDGRCLGPLVLGTQRVVVELVGALWRVGGLSRIRVVLPATAADRVRGALEALVGVEIVPDNGAQLPPTDVAHRPFQVTSDADLATLRSWGHRVVIGQLDSMAYANPFYFPTYAAWEAYAAATEVALAGADAVTAISHHSGEEAVAHGLVDRERLHVVPLGVDHLGDAAAGPAPSERLSELDGVDFLACVGTDYHHKNRLFALRVLGALVDGHGWEGRLVLAGPAVPDGSSVPDEDAFLSERPQLLGRVMRLDWLGDAERTWIIANSRLVLYPSVDEGFGFMPFEAAGLDTPCLFPAQGSLAEIDAGAAILATWDPHRAAAQAMRLMAPGPERAANIASIGRRGRELTWERTARSTLEVYRAAVRRPARLRAATRVAAMPPAPTPQIGLPARDELPEEVHDALMAVARRRTLARAMFGGVVRAHRLVRSARTATRGGGS